MTRVEENIELKSTQDYQYIYWNPEWNLKISYTFLSFTDLLQLIEKLAESLCITSFDNQLATSPLKTGYSQKAVARHANESGYWLVDQICCKMSTNLLELTRFWRVFGSYDNGC